MAKEKEKVNVPILINVTKDMEKDIRDMANDMGLGISGFIRMAIANEIKKQRD